MGQTLSIPATDKTTESGGNDKYHYAVSEMQGWRITMEDAHTAILNLEENDPKANTFFAVYDGHGGAAVAKYAGANVHARLLKDEAYKSGDIRLGLKNAFLGTDADMRASPEFARDASGCTAVAALITQESVYVANAGDSRSVISVKGEAKPLSYDHKPQNDTEKTRIVAAGGYIEYGRVNGNLALARALGDFEYKKNASIGPEAQIITCDPEIIEHTISPEDEFIVIACDGIWDCLSSQQCVNVVRLLISQGKKLPEICEDICELCLAPDTTTGAGIGCDNMTVMVVAVLRGKTLDEWYQWVTDRTKSKHGYATPETLPQIYSASRLLSFKSRREAYETRLRERREREARDKAAGQSSNSSGNVGTSLFGGFASVLGGDGPLTLQQVGDDDDDDDDDSDDDPEHHGAGARSLLGGNGFFSQPIQLDMTKSLREQLQELDAMGVFGGGGESHDVEMGDIDDEGSARIVEVDADQDPDQDSKKDQEDHPNDAADDSGAHRTETPPPPAPQPNGDVQQLKTEPQGDAPSAAVKAEGLMDTSESPLKV